MLGVRKNYKFFMIRFDWQLQEKYCPACKACFTLRPDKLANDR
ncbi:Uncharacterized protein dnm_086040 [Desulfonema magnum]|uniref:Uncharacterized protein n=1 Tax=Desulfonema magnum TaxID=45655 RepID=A0A975BVI5_9BACT|nr:Uncharacterized protein dnm_086040 [Desulfonema magnum]